MLFNLGIFRKPVNHILLLIDMLKRQIDQRIVVESFPTLLVSMINLLMTGVLFDKIVDSQVLRKYSIIQESIFILGFKGNIELGVAMNLSSKRITNPKNFRFILYNINHLIRQSVSVGLISGCIGFITSLIYTESFKITHLLRSCISCVLSCFGTTFIFVGVLIMIIEFCYFLSIDSKNLVLPLLSTLNDFTTVQGLVISSNIVENMEIDIILTLFFLSLFLYGFTLFISRYSEKFVQKNAKNILGFSCITNVISGLILEKYTQLFPNIALSYPVLSGMTGSILFTYVHHRFEERSLDINGKVIKLTFTLIVISGVVSVFFVVITGLFGMWMGFVFSIMYVLIFVFQTIFLLIFVNIISHHWKCFKKHSSINILPIISSTSDLAAVMFLVMLSVVIY